MIALSQATGIDVLTEPGMLYADIDIDNDDRLTSQMRELLKEIRERFKPETDEHDKMVLYEVTNFKDESNCPADFWEQYEDFAELGNEKLTNTKKIDLRALTKKAKKLWKKDRQRDAELRNARASGRPEGEDNQLLPGIQIDDDERFY